MGFGVLVPIMATHVIMDILRGNQLLIQDLGITTPSLTSSETTGIPIFETTSIEFLDFTTAASPTTPELIPATTAALDQVLLAELLTTNTPESDQQSTRQNNELTQVNQTTQPKTDNEDTPHKDINNGLKNYEKRDLKI